MEGDKDVGCRSESTFGTHVGADPTVDAKTVEVTALRCPVQICPTSNIKEQAQTRLILANGARNKIIEMGRPGFEPGAFACLFFGALFAVSCYQCQSDVLGQAKPSRNNHLDYSSRCSWELTRRSAHSYRAKVNR